MTEVARLEPLMCELIGSARLVPSATETAPARKMKRKRTAACQNERGRLTARGASTHTRPARTPRTE